jgi:hypothetical protein
MLPDSCLDLSLDFQVSFEWLLQKEMLDRRGNSCDRGHVEEISEREFNLKAIAQVRDVRSNAFLVSLVATSVASSSRAVFVRSLRSTKGSER